jgi:hypothetical protein
LNQTNDDNPKPKNQHQLKAQHPHAQDAHLCLSAGMFAAAATCCFNCCTVWLLCAAISKASSLEASLTFTVILCDIARDCVQPILRRKSKGSRCLRTQGKSFGWCSRIPMT